MRAREALLETALIEGDLSRVFPICTPGASDSASFDEVLELLHLGGRSLPHSVLMMIPEAWENHTTMDRDRRAFYRYHASLMEPWDGPAAVCLHRRHASSAPCSTATACARRATGSPTTGSWCWPARSASSTSPPSASCARVACSRAACSSSTRPRVASSRTRRSRPSWPPSTPTRSGWPTDQVRLDELPARTMLTPQHGSVVTQQRLFGYTNEELRVILAPMARTGAEPIGSMGSDTSIAVLSDRSRLLYDYFTQLFAQVTNPPLDAIREELVTSLSATIGPEANLLEACPGSCRQIMLPLPVIDRDDLAKLMYVNEHGETPGLQGLRRRRALRRPRGGRGGRADGRRRRGAAARHRRGAAPGLGGHRGGCQHHRPLGPQLDLRVGAHPVAAAHRGRAPPPGAREDADQGAAW